MSNDNSDSLVIQIPISKGYTALVSVDDEDLKELNWCADVARHTVYVYKKSPGNRTIHLHSVVLSRVLKRELIKGEAVDHINRNALDNRRSNLRLASPTESARNRGIRSNNTSGYKGVYWCKQNNKWKVTITINRKQKHLGFFTNIKDGARAYNRAAMEYFGEFAYLNPIEE